MTNDIVWQTKLHARLHDPAEKALVLLRDPAGHEGGTSRALHRALFQDGIPPAIAGNVRRADWWAAAADRPQWPMEVTVSTGGGDTRTFAVARWAQVHWTKVPVLIHPLTGATFDLGRSGGLRETEIGDIKERSLEHFAGLVQRDAGKTDWRRTSLAFWRFGPSLSEVNDNGTLGALWPLLPADTRVPDHSIWEHLDLTSAFAGAFAADPNGDAALLTVSLGPVQSFIEAARSTSDMWAGSHLLSRLAWEAMKTVCEELGPDAILFPRLRAVPQVDVWLRDECGLPADLFADCDWARGATDANPLFSAALPNRFVAIVPRSTARELARKIERNVREWLQERGKEVVDRLLEAAGLGSDGEQHCHRQMREQLEGFPEVHWAVAPFSLVRPRNRERQTDLDTSALAEAMAPFHGVATGEPCGFLASPAWKVLCKELKWDDNTTFHSPNPGVTYPAVHDLAERALAAAKAVRPFSQSPQRGWRCSLTGETEWLTADPAQLRHSYRQQDDTLWARVAAKKPAWAKPGEHLGALAALKRLWPTLFAEEVGRAVRSVADSGSAQRFVVSTHTMALAYQLDRWLERGGSGDEDLAAALERVSAEPVALPRRLMQRHAGKEALSAAKRLPSMLEADAGQDDEARNRRIVQRTLGSNGGDGERLESYYGMLLMDGDHMGAWLAGDDQHAISYRESFHPQVRSGFDSRADRQPLLRAYADQLRAMSPNRHLAISAALNDFSLVVARHVVESEHLGRLIYAGGDDVLAMLPVADLLPAMLRLRTAYSGHDPAHVDGDLEGLALKHGFALLREKSGNRWRLMRMMGERATASCGAVVAHHQAPLSAVMRELRTAERRAKNEGARDAFSLAVIKRSGGALRVTAKWSAVPLLVDLRRFLGADGVSRRAAYNTFEWLKDLPDDRPDLLAPLLASLLAYQLERQADPLARKEHDVPGLARRLADAALDPQQHPRRPNALDWLQHFMSVAEFLARETRSRE